MFVQIKDHPFVLSWPSKYNVQKQPSQNIELRDLNFVPECES